MATHTLSTLVPLNMPPVEAHHIGAYRKNGEKVGNIALGGFRRPAKRKLYSFGILSDVHNQQSQVAECREDTKNALAYLTNEKRVEFTVICGDLTQTYSNNDAELGYYADNVASVEGCGPVYPCTGNHDCPTSGSVDIERFKAKTGISDLYTSESTYSYEVTKTHGATVDHFLFLCLKQQSQNGWYDENDLKWLDRKLKEYQNDRCFVITHLFFPDWCGNFGRYYPSNLWLSGNQLLMLSQIARDYPRSIWFSGHSHWKWYLQCAQKNANVYPLTVERNMAQTVHMPSCTKPIDSDDTNPEASKDRDDDIGNVGSEGAVVDVYEDCIDIHGIEFKANGRPDYANWHVPLAHYRINTDPYEGYAAPQPQENFVPTMDPAEAESIGIRYVTSEMIRENPDKATLTKVPSEADLAGVTEGVGVYVDETTHDVTVKLCASGTGFFIAKDGSFVSSGSDGSMTGTDIAEDGDIKIYHDGIVWLQNEPASSLLSKIGIVGPVLESNPTNTQYTLASGVHVDGTRGGIRVQSSASFSGTAPTVFRIRNLRYVFVGKNSVGKDISDGYVRLTQSMVHFAAPKVAGASATVDSKHDLTMVFTGVSQGFYVNDGGKVSGNYVEGGLIDGTKNVVVENDGIEWLSGTPELLARSTKVGLYASNNGYDNTDGANVSFLTYKALQYGISSSYVTSGGTLPVALKIKNVRIRVS